MRKNNEILELKKKNQDEPTSNDKIFLEKQSLESTKFSPPIVANFFNCRYFDEPKMIEIILSEVLETINVLGYDINAGLWQKVLYGWLQPLHLGPALKVKRH